MDPDVISFAVVSTIIICLVGALAVIGVFTWRAVTRGGLPPRSLPVDDDRLEHLQQSVDAIAIEVERIAEAQRFSAKLLVERGESQSLGR